MVHVDFATLITEEIFFCGDSCDLFRLFFFVKLHNLSTRSDKVYNYA